MPTKRTPKQVSRVADDPVPRRPLAGTIAVAAGATRGAGRGIARALGEAGQLTGVTPSVGESAIAQPPRLWRSHAVFYGSTGGGGSSSLGTSSESGGVRRG